jgi:putative membrane protein
MKLLMRLAINVFALLVVAYIVPGFILVDLWSAVVAAIIIGVVNTFIRPFVQLVALPITLMTFGLFALIINVLLIWGVSVVVPGFEIAGFTTALIGSVVLSLVSWFLARLARD